MHELAFSPLPFLPATEDQDPQKALQKEKNTTPGGAIERCFALTIALQKIMPNETYFKQADQH